MSCRTSRRPAAEASAPAAPENDAVGPDRPRHVLEVLLATVVKREIELGKDLLVHGAGKADAARLGNPFQARRDVDAVAENVVAVEDDISEVDADPIADAPVLGNVRLARGHCLLDCDRTLNRIDHAGELDQHAVAGGLDDAPPVRRDLGVDQRLAVLLLARDGAGLVGLHEPGVADHVGGKDGRQSPLKRIVRHGTLSSRSARLDRPHGRHGPRPYTPSRPAGSARYSRARQLRTSPRCGSIRRRASTRSPG